jgi:hypothetical protein
MFKITFDSASTTTIVSKWLSFGFIFNWGNEEKWLGAKSGEWVG